LLAFSSSLFCVCLPPSTGLAAWLFVFFSVTAIARSSVNHHRRRHYLLLEKSCRTATVAGFSFLHTHKCVGRNSWTRTVILIVVDCVVSADRYHYLVTFCCLCCLVAHHWALKDLIIIDAKYMRSSS
ncbi:unnamed protein product, partial [Discosporangium mesarthrocarpum]